MIPNIQSVDSNGNITLLTTEVLTIEQINAGLSQAQQKVANFTSLLAKATDDVNYWTTLQTQANNAITPSGN